jgi:hypothetical protein
MPDVARHPLRTTGFEGGQGPFFQRNIDQTSLLEKFCNMIQGFEQDILNTKV